MANPNPSLETRFGAARGNVQNRGGKRRRLLASVEERMHAQGVNPADELLKLYSVADDIKDKIRIMIELLSYCQPKPREEGLTEEEMKALELKFLSTAELWKLVKEKMPEAG